VTLGARGGNHFVKARRADSSAFGLAGRETACTGSWSLRRRRSNKGRVNNEERSEQARIHEVFWKEVRVQKNLASWQIFSATKRGSGRYTIDVVINSIRLSVSRETETLTDRKYRMVEFGQNRVIEEEVTTPVRNGI
jgi:hypothetical protein